jgi:hypothetical protein
LITAVCLLVGLIPKAQPATVNSPDKKLVVQIFVREGIPHYLVNYNGNRMLDESPLGLIANIDDFSSKMVLKGQKTSTVNKTYSQSRIKRSLISYQANELVCHFENEQKKQMDVTFRVSNNDIAFRYAFPKFGETAQLIVEREITGFRLPSGSTTFLTPQAPPMTGWKKTKPSYEEEYKADQPLGIASQYGLGYTFPALFRIDNKGWVLISETGVSSLYCGSRLSEGSADGLYSIAFPEQGENNGIGSAAPALALPGYTPWRTITVGDNLAPIAETTIPFDVTEPLYEPSIRYKPGRSTWSWIMWQDNSINYDDQVKCIDLAAAMGYEYVLIDGLWDKQIGYEKMPALIRYAQSKKVDVFLWYNSNGYWSDAPQGPKQRMNTSVARKAEMKWLKSLGVKGLKIDFFGGDKQQTMQLYEDILTDANEFGLMIIFHGCTLPRGWERMYPNYVSSEAVRSSENLIFTQNASDNEAFNACLHPFIRNAAGSMEFGPVLLNKRLNRNNDGGSIRRTTDIFQLATAILFQSAVQNFAITPNNLKEAPPFEIDFMKKIPTTWDDIKFIDGYPGKYCVIARRSGNNWYVAGVNARKEKIKLDLRLPMFGGKSVIFYADDNERNPYHSTMRLNNNSAVTLEIQPGGGFIFTDQQNKL